MRLYLLMIFAWSVSGARPVLNDTDLIIHEWGTFTSLHGSNGKLQQGLHHGDEPLPYFVHCPLLGLGGYNRCLDFSSPGENSPLAVNQRLETPVIYYHSKVDRQVKIKVDFPQGVFSEWYPAADHFAPVPGAFNSVKDGTATWTADVVTTPLKVPPVSDDSIWAPSRRVDANYIRSNGENERFVFYRGIGAFQTPFRTSSENDTLTFGNTSPQTIPAAILMHVTETHGSFRELGSIAANSEIQVSEVSGLSQKQIPIAEFMQVAGDHLQRHLEATGLYKDEAVAMVDTWRKSYFKTPGLRVLYIVPNVWTERILPMQITPTPTELVRTLVGRVELMMPAEERQLRDVIEGARVSGERFLAYQLGRFAEPKLWRIHQLMETEEQKAYVLRLIQQVTR